MTYPNKQALMQPSPDELTCFPNREALENVLSQAIQDARHGASNGALVLIAIDRFKMIAHRLDPASADLLRHEVMARLDVFVQQGGTVARCGEEEFALICNFAEQSSTAANICKSALQAMDDLFVIGKHMLHLTCRIGIASFPEDSDDAATLVRYAGLALQQAQENGLGVYQMFSSQMSEQSAQRLALRNALSTAVEEGQLVLRYQPIVDLQTGRLAGLEALGWWQHPQLGNLSSERFISIVEQSELIAGIGEWMLRKACEDMQSWIKQGASDFQVALNILPSQFRDLQLADKIQQVLAEGGIAPSMLSLEIAQSALPQDLMSSQLQLRKLKALGVGLVLDEFGVGPSPLAHLKHLPVDKVKIARTFIQTITTNAANAAISSAVIAMAHGLGIKAAADGIDTDGQYDFMLRHVCDEIQGAFYSAPMPSGGVPALLSEGRRLPKHMLRIQRPQRTLLLVDDEPNILAALKRLLRRDGYEILAAGSGKEGLELLARHEVDVIVSDQRMPSMTGVEFLRTAKGICPDTVRIVLSGYTELQSVTDAVNEGAIYKFLTKPWEDRLLREHIEEAFRHKEMADENRRLNLEVRTANQELAAANRQMEEILQQKQQQIKHNEISLDIIREMLQHIPLPVIGLDDEDMIVFVNTAAETLFMESGPVLGSNARSLLPEFFRTRESPDTAMRIAKLGDALFQVASYSMGGRSRSSGRLVTLVRMEG